MIFKETSFKKTLFISGFLTLSLAAATQALAVETEANLEAETTAETLEASFPIWSSSAELGAIFTQGNTESKSLNAKLEAQRKGQTWLSGLKLSALNSEDDQKTTKEKYTGQLKLNRNLSQSFYLAMQTLYEKDRFAGFEYQNTASIGLGYHAIKTEATKLSLEAGPGYYREKIRTTKQVNDEMIGRLNLIFSQQLNPHVSLGEEASYEFGSENKILRSETSLKSQLNSRLAAKITYTLKNTDQVAANKKHTDTELGITLVFDF